MSQTDNRPGHGPRVACILLWILGTLSLPTAAAAQVPVGHWRFDEGSGPVAADETGNSDGTVVGAAWVGPAVVGTALDFDGVDDHVFMANTPALDIQGTAITLVAWILPRDGGDPNGSRILSKRNDGGGSDVYAMYTYQNRLRFRLDGSDLVSQQTLQTGQWQHVAMVYDGVDKRIYLDGVLDGATPQAKSDPIDGSSRGLHLGMREGEARHYNGLLDEVQVHAAALSAAQILALYNAVPPPPPPPGFLAFSDVTATAGTAGPSDGGHGVMFADVNGDDLPDLYLTNLFQNTGARSDRFFLNLGGAVFAEQGVMRGIDDLDGGSHGAVWADLDNDGDYDLANGSTWTAAGGTFGFPDHNNVYRNDGSGFFSDLTPPAVLSSLIETRGFTAFDCDGDGDLDLFGVPGRQEPGINEAFLGDGSFGFSSHTGGDLVSAVAMQGVIDTDFDGDGDVDVMAGNWLGDFAILENDGSCSFTQVSPSTLGITEDAFDGITTGDVDNDGDLDILLVTDGTAHLFLRGSGGSYSLQQTIGGGDGYMGGFADLDKDGDLDLVMAGDGLAYLNDGSGSFSAGPAIPETQTDPRAIAFADIDDDGDLDFAIAAKGSPNGMIRTESGATNWLKVKLFSPEGQAGAFGAWTTVYAAGDAGGAILGLRESKGNHGYLGQDDPVLHFGLGLVESVDVVVRFLDTTQVTVEDVAVNQTITVTVQHVPALPLPGLAALATLVGLAAFGFLRRRR